MTDTEHDPSPDTEPAPYVAEHVREALATDGRTTALGIDVTVTPDAVYLAGTVGSPEQRDELTTVAHEVVPDRPVRNDVAVVTGDPDPDVEELR